jgi:ATP adenylyltransferase
VIQMREIGYSALIGMSTIPLLKIICYNKRALCDDMEFLWSPWRMEYIQSHSHNENCVFCEALRHTDNVDNLVMYRGNLAFIILNRFPYTTGHLMVVPFDHQPSLELLDSETSHELMFLAQKSIELLRAVYQPQGFNVGINIGEAAGAGIVDHVHMHVVPRWNGDTNFMSTLAATRVLPESLEDTYNRLREVWAKDFQS